MNRYLRLVGKFNLPIAEFKSKAISHPLIPKPVSLQNLCFHLDGLQLNFCLNNAVALDYESLRFLTLFCFTIQRQSNQTAFE